MQPVIAPSILAADIARLGEEVDLVLTAGANWVHVDVMDNHYVPNLTFGPEVCAALRRYGIKAPLDVHLMVEPVDALVPQFAAAGATMITFHPEASKHPHRTLQLIHAEGCQAGIALNPGTSLNWIEELAADLDMVLLMSVNPGFGGQAFIHSSLAKITRTRTLLQQLGRDIRIEVDGGITPDNINQIQAAGADTFVMGSAIFNSRDYQVTIQQVRAAL